MRKLIPSFFLIFVIFIIPTSTALYAQSKINLMEQQKKEKERLKKLEQEKKKTVQLNNSSLDNVKGTVKFQEKKSYSILEKKKTFITEKGAITFSDGGLREKIRKQFPGFDKIGRLGRLSNKLQRNIVESSFLVYVQALAIFIGIFYIAVMWRIFTKAEYSGFLSLIPLVNLYVFIKIAGRSGFWFFLMLIPFLNIALSVVLHIDIAKRFGQSTIFGLGLSFLGFIFYPVLAFTSIEYEGERNEFRRSSKTTTY